MPLPEAATLDLPPNGDRHRVVSAAFAPGPALARKPAPSAGPAPLHGVVGRLREDAKRALLPSRAGPSGAVVVLVEVAGVLCVPVTVVEVVDVVTVWHGFMPAVLAVDVLVVGLVVMLVIGGRTHLVIALSSARFSCHRRDLRSIGSTTRTAWVTLNRLEAIGAAGHATGLRQSRLHGDEFQYGPES